MAGYQRWPSIKSFNGLLRSESHHDRRSPFLAGWLSPEASWVSPGRSSLGNNCEANSSSDASSETPPAAGGELGGACPKPAMRRPTTAEQRTKETATENERTDGMQVQSVGWSGKEK